MSKGELGIVLGLLGALGITLGIVTQKTSSNNNSNNEGSTWNLKNNLKKINKLIDQLSTNPGMNIPSTVTNQTLKGARKKLNGMNTLNNNLLPVLSAISQAESQRMMNKEAREATNFFEYTEQTNPGQTIKINGKRYANQRVATNDWIYSWLRVHPTHQINKQYILPSAHFSAINRALHAVKNQTNNQTKINKAAKAALAETKKNLSNLNSGVKNAALAAYKNM
jgi:hypothetical protein